MKLLVLLLLVALISKEIVVFNEEFLIGISFILFIVVLLRTLKNTVVQEFDNRASLIAKDFELANKYKESLLEQELSAANKEATLTGPILNGLLASTLESIKHISNCSRKEVRVQLKQQLESKLDRLRVIELQELGSVKRSFLNKMFSARVRRLIALSSLKAKRLIVNAKASNPNFIALGAAQSNSKRIAARNRIISNTK